MSNQTFHSITYADRMQNPIHKCKTKVEHYDTYVMQEERVLNEKIGRLVTKSKFVKVDRKALSHLKVSDFSLENLQAVGAPLNPCSLKHDINTATSIMENNIEKFNQSNPE